MFSSLQIQQFYRSLYGRVLQSYKSTAKLSNKTMFTAGTTFCCCYFFSLSPHFTLLSVVTVYFKWTTVLKAVVRKPTALAIYE